VVPAGDYAEVVPTLACSGPSRCRTTSTVDAFAAALARPGAGQGPLLDQRLVAGVGNIYADEALWRARIHPRPAASAAPGPRAARGDPSRCSTAAIEREGTTFRDYQMVNGQSGRYATSSTPTARRVGPAAAAARPASHRRRPAGTTYCPRCQRIWP
jgi:formamidopyrimidine-DNA glycosylase